MPAQPIHGVGDEVLRAETFFDVREERVGGFDEIRAFAAAHLDFGDAKPLQHVGGRSAGGLRAPLERIERAIIDARAGIGHAVHGFCLECTEGSRGLDQNSSFSISACPTLRVAESSAACQ